MIKYDATGNPIAEVEVVMDDEGDIVGETETPYPPDKLRQLAYVREADPYKDQADNYQTEADALRDAGDEGAAVVAETKARDLRAQYLAAKQAIRGRYPDVAGQD